MDNSWDKYLDDALVKMIHDCLKDTFRRTPPEALTHLIGIVKEKVLPLLWNEGVPITEKELLNLFEDWFVRIGRFRVSSSTEMQHQKKSTDYAPEPMSTKLICFHVETTVLRGVSIARERLLQR